MEKAVFRIFHRLRIPPGGVLGRTMLLKEWRRTSLRRCDLDACIRRLSALCYLQPEHTPDGERVQLTPAGHEHMSHLFAGPLQSLRQSLRMGWLALSRPVGDGRPALQHRRVGDRIAPSLG